MSWYDPDREDNTIYTVVVNHEEQYSIWPVSKERRLPPVWVVLERKKPGGFLGESPGVANRWQNRTEGRMPGLHQGGLDGHAPSEFA